MSARKTFGEYLKTSPGTTMRSRIILGEYPGVNFDSRLTLSAYDIDSLLKLQTWSRLRWPDWYTRRGGEDHDGPTGKQVMAYLWADYLHWAESGAAR